MKLSVPKRGARRKDGSYIKFDDNAVLSSKMTKPQEEHVFFGPVARELREKQFMKIVSFGSGSIIGGTRLAMLKIKKR